MKFYCSPNKIDVHSMNKRPPKAPVNQSAQFHSIEQRLASQSDRLKNQAMSTTLKSELKSVETYATMPRLPKPETQRAFASNQNAASMCPRQNGIAQLSAAGQSSSRSAMSELQDREAINDSVYRKLDGSENGMKGHQKPGQPSTYVNSAAAARPLTPARPSDDRARVGNVIRHSVINRTGRRDDGGLPSNGVGYPSAATGVLSFLPLATESTSAKHVQPTQQPRGNVGEYLTRLDDQQRCLLEKVKKGKSSAAR